MTCICSELDDVSSIAFTGLPLLVGFLFVKANCTEKVAQNLWKRSHITITEEVAYFGRARTKKNCET
ncbi:hypothetical protein PanWU01x14_089420 [Parasponia andersonii]|uniref:Uncharacterized protein n=1 Tax=Parasponia andersonii TaxID=3476 RepID=A0A2P5D7D8_PARAD|nr:hypothetical protein PanWU01x14_089420 [Parasponia andersonii]